MGLVFLIVLGALLGWLAAIVMRAEQGRGILLNVAAGIGGALVTGLVVGPLLGFGSLLEGRHSVDGLLKDDLWHGFSPWNDCGNNDRSLMG